MMNMYSEYYSNDKSRKATVSIVERHWDAQLSQWEVVLYEGDRILQKLIVHSESKAEDLAEDFVDGGSKDPVLLNESK